MAFLKTFTLYTKNIILFMSIGAILVWILDFTDEYKNIKAGSKHLVNGYITFLGCIFRYFHAILLLIVESLQPIVYSYRPYIVNAMKNFTKEL
jgi:hypothetical protein